MKLNVLEVLSPGLGATLQDRGRAGWRRYGVPVSGTMDDHAATWANRLLDNAPDAPVLELLLQGARLAVRHDAWIVVAGADAEASLALWRPTRVRAGTVIEFSHNHSGVWTYVAVAGGWEAPRLLGSASAYPRGRLGRALVSGDVLQAPAQTTFQLPAGIANRTLAPSERRHYDAPPPLRVWPGPQWDLFSPTDREAFFSHAWTVSSQSDRVGYRLAGPVLKPGSVQIISEPVRVGSIQVPENGQPIVTMRDGPTVGGYPKLGLVAPADLSWLAQCRPGQPARFEPIS